MKLQYKSKKMEKILTDQRLMRRMYNPLHKNIGNRLSELRAANHLGEIPTCPPPKRHKLSGGLDGHWGINISKNYRIIIKPVGKFDPNELSTIVEIEIVSIEDYH